MTMPADGAGLIGGGKGKDKDKDKGLVLDKLPLLGDVFDQVASICAEGMRERCSAAVQLRTQGMAAEREDTILKSFDHHILAFILHDADWGCRIAVVLEQDLVFTLIETMLGGDGSDEAFKEPRPFSTIERGVAKAFVEIVVDALNRVLSPMSPADFELEKVDTRLDFVTLGGRTEEALLARIGFESLGRSGEMSLIFPRVAINRVKSHLSKAPPALETKLVDPVWTQQFERRVTRAEVLVQAAVDVDGYVLGDIAALVVGQVVPLGDHAQRQIALSSEGEALFSCELGQSDGFYSIRITSEFDHEAVYGQATMELADF
jgi:flagellar motor switch protein FliM